MLTWSNLAKFQKMLRDAHRPEIPRELGPTVTVPEAAAILNRSVSWVRARIADGRLNAWQDPYTRRYHIVLDDVHRLTPAQPPQPSTLNPQPSTTEDDGIRPFSHDTYGAAGVLEDAERESERRYQARLAQLDAELAALRAELGITEDDTEDDEEGAEIAADTMTPPPAAPNQPTSSNLLPPELGGRGGQLPPELGGRGDQLPPELGGRGDQSKIETPFPAGWVRARIAMAMLDCTEATLLRLVTKGSLERRTTRTGKTRPVYLYDSAQVAAVAEQRLKRLRHTVPIRNVRWWGSRSQKMDLNWSDYYVGTRDAAAILGVSQTRVRRMCDTGMLPCYQKEPGKTGSRVFIPHSHLVALRDRHSHRQRHERWRKSRANTLARQTWEERGLDINPREHTQNTLRDYGELYTTRQVALLLGINVYSVHALRRKGRLAGVQRPRRPNTSGKQWWFFRKDDVHALQADPEYIKHSAQGKRAAWLARPQAAP